MCMQYALWLCVCVGALDLERRVWAGRACVGRAHGCLLSTWEPCMPSQSQAVSNGCNLRERRGVGRRDAGARVCASKDYVVKELGRREARCHACVTRAQ